MGFDLIVISLVTLIVVEISLDIFVVNICSYLGSLRLLFFYCFFIVVVFDVVVVVIVVINVVFVPVLVVAYGDIIQ